MCSSVLREPRVTRLRRLVFGGTQVIDDCFRFADAVLLQDGNRIGKRGCVGHRRAGCDHSRIVAGNVGNSERNHFRRRAGRGEAPALHRRKMLAYAVHLGDVRAAPEQRLVDRLLVRERQAWRRQRQQRGAATRNQEQHQIVGRQSLHHFQHALGRFASRRRRAQDARLRQPRSCWSARDSRSG